MEILEQIDLNINNSSNNNIRGRRSNNVGTNKTIEISCLLCKQNHSIYKCDTFLGLDVKSRLNKIRKLGACIN